MSRIGKRILVIPEGVTVNVNDSRVSVSGKLGSLELEVKPGIQVSVDNGNVTVTRENDSKELKQLHGTTNANIKNMIEGVSTGFKKELEINGVGYRFQVAGNTLTISAGYSHPVKMEAPKGITIEAPSQTELNIMGFDKQVVGEFAAQVRKVRGPEPYKGKGIKYKDEFIRRKEGKKAA
ncbi:50S ribosomal protein L6 [Clostridium sp. CAG:628]|jgi:large subunit ribosomal protein L6|nr:50S ribosomal protein L6 [Clostridium sp. CAG:628]